MNSYCIKIEYMIFNIMIKIIYLVQLNKFNILKIMKIFIILNNIFKIIFHIKFLNLILFL